MPAGLARAPATRLTRTEQRQLGVESGNVTHRRYTGSLHAATVAAMGKMQSRPDVRERFGFAVKVRREELGLTQEDLAEKAGIHRTYLSDVERGTRNLSLVNI